MRPTWDETEETLLQRVNQDIRGKRDPLLRLPEMLEVWRGILSSLVVDVNIQLAQRRAEIAKVEAKYAREPDNERLYLALLTERERYAEWMRNSLTYKRGTLQRLHEADYLIRRNRIIADFPEERSEE